MLPTISARILKRSLVTCLLVLFHLSIAAPAIAQVEASLVSGGDAPGGGGSIVAIELKHAPGWHTYWINPGTGAPTTAKWSLPPGWRAGEISWPVPMVIRGSDGKPTGHGYEKTVYLPVVLTAPAGARGPVPVSANVKWLMCEAERCIPGGATLKLDLMPAAPVDPAIAFALSEQAMPVQDPAAEISAALRDRTISFDFTGVGSIRDPHFFPASEIIWHDSKQAFTAQEDGLSLSAPVDESWEGATNHISGVLAYTDTAGRYRGLLIDTPVAGGVASTSPAAPGIALASLPLTLLFAFLGGLILNFMPCVLPVLSIKALSLAQGGGVDARREGLHYAAGVMATFASVGGFMLTLRATMGGIGWGFQLQNPYMVLTLALLMAGIGFNLAGLFEVGVTAGGVGHGLIARAGRSRSFLTGTLAVVVATPCTAPFMAAALGAALLASAPVAMAIFVMMGLGMAAPFLLLAFWPQARAILPKPGAWMVTFRVFLAFPMFATAIWLLWVLGSQRGLDAMALGLVATVALALALWALNNSGQRNPVHWHLTALIAVGLIAGSVWMIPQAAPAIENRSDATALYSEDAYSLDALDAALASGQPVFAYFTADWCVTCKVNERVALHTADTAALFKQKNVRVLVGDWTSQNPEITAILAQYGRAGVPLYLYFPPGTDRGGAKVLPQLLTNEIVRTHIG